MSALPEQVPEALAEFLQLSVTLTGFDDYELLGTGLLETYYEEVLRIIGAREAGALLGAAQRIPDGDETAFRTQILNDCRFGPVARSILTMWYLGAWAQLPREWRNSYGATNEDTDHVVSAAAYREGLVWPAAGTHPMGAKQQGFGSWAKPSALRVLP
jgi:hypothetical protein